MRERIQFLHARDLNFPTFCKRISEYNHTYGSIWKVKHNFQVCEAVIGELCREAFKKAIIQYCRRDNAATASAGTEIAVKSMFPFMQDAKVNSLWSKYVPHVLRCQCYFS